MKIKRRSIMAICVASVILTLTACGSKMTTSKTGLIPDYATLSTDPTGYADSYFVKKDVVWGAYEKVMIDNVNFFIRDDAEYKGIDANEFRELETYFNASMIKSLKTEYAVVQEPEPLTLRLKPA